MTVARFAAFLVATCAVVLGLAVACDALYHAGHVALAVTLCLGGGTAWALAFVAYLWHQL